MTAPYTFASAPSPAPGRTTSPWADLLFVVAYLFYLGAFIPALRFARGLAFYPGESDPVSSAVQALVLVLLVAVSLAHWRKLWPTLRVAAPYVALVLLCLASAAWSDYPDITIRRTVALAGCLLLAHVGVSLIGLDRMIRLIGVATLIAAIASLAAFVLIPSIGRDLEIFGGTMRGVFAQKNVFADAMLPGFASFLFLWQRQPGQLRMLLAAGLLLLCIVLAGSVSALGIAILIASVALLFKARAGRRNALIYLYASLALVGAVLAIFFPENLVQLIGRDLTLTGRVELWQRAAGFVGDHPLLGHGYGAFWTADSPRSELINHYLGWSVPDAHNGFLDLALQLGLAGLALAVLILATTGVLSWAAIRNRSLPEAHWIVLVLVLVVVANLNESRLLEASAFTTILFSSWLALRLKPRVTVATSEGTPRPYLGFGAGRSGTRRRDSAEPVRHPQ